MKRLELQICFLFYICQIYGQPLINDFGDYQIGDTFNYDLILNLNGLEPFEPIGNDTIWDLSQIELEGLVRTSVVINCEEATFSDSFEDCDYVLRENNGLLQFYGSNEEVLLYLGNNSNSQANVYSPPVPIFINPMNLNDTFVDSEHTLMFSSGSEEWFHKGRYSSYGTLILPNNVQHENVALLYQEIGRIDNSYNSISYNWIREDETSLVRIQFAKFGSNDPILELGTVTLDVEPVRVNEDVKENEILIIPNPTKNLVKIWFGKIKSKVSIRVLNLSGQEISNKEVLNIDHAEIDLSNVSRGIYLVFLNIDGNISIERIIKK